MEKTELEFTRMFYVRVSEIIGKQTMEEMRSIPVDVLANAAVRGTKVHDYCAAYVKGLWICEIEEEYEPYVNCFVSWYQENVERVIYTNKRLYDDEKKFTGEFDMIVKMKNTMEIAMIDLKTSANVSRSWPIQLAAYKHLCELSGFHVDSYMNLHLKKKKPAVFEGEGEHKKMVTPPLMKAVPLPISQEDLTHSWDIFSSALKCYDYFDRKGGK